MVGLLSNIVGGLTGNLHWAIGGLFIGVMTAVILPFLTTNSHLENLPLLIVLLIVLLAITFLARISIVHDTATGFGVSGFLAAPVGLGGMLLGRFVALRQGDGSRELVAESQAGPGRVV